MKLQGLGITRGRVRKLKGMFYTRMDAVGGAELRANQGVYTSSHEG